jgi:hypothetical protein
MIAFYIIELSIKILRNALFMDSIDSIVDKTVVWYGHGRPPPPLSA